MAEWMAILDAIDIQAEHWSNISLHLIINYLRSPTPDLTGCLKRRAVLFTLRRGVLYRHNYERDGRLWLLVVPRNLQRDIIRLNDDDISAGHLGFDKTYFSVRSPFFWKSMNRAINKYVRACHHSQTRKQPRTQLSGALRQIYPADLSFQRVGINFFGPFPSTPKKKSRCIITAMNHMNRHAETRAIPVATAEGYFTAVYFATERHRYSSVTGARHFWRRFSSSC